MNRAHSKLIDALGGTAAVAKLTDEDPRVVSNWRQRGVSHRWRGQLARIAERRGIALPKDFLPNVEGVAA